MSDAPLTLTWDKLTIGQWRAYLKKAPHSNLLLTWLTAKTTFQTYGKRPQFGVFKHKGKAIGLVVASVRKLGFLERIYVHRGPVWLGKQPPKAWQKNALELLHQQWPSKWGRRVFFMPELDDTPPNRQLLKETGFRPAGGLQYSSIWLDISQPMPMLKKNMTKGWRSSLKKAEKAGLTLHQDPSPMGLKLFLRGYIKDRKEKKYPGPSPRFLYQLHKNAQKGELFMLEAWHEGQLVGAQLFFCHGETATYFVGWITPKGRTLAAHNGLLFGTIKYLKKRGVTTLDLGGLSPKAPTLNRFKKGLGGQIYTLIGDWTL